jgi:membrane protein DedA with SNARE-associated domain
VADTNTLWVCLAVFGSLVGAGLGFPIPEEIPIVTAGGMAGHAAEPPQPQPTAALRWENARTDAEKQRAAEDYLRQSLALLAVNGDAAFPATLPWYAIHQNGEWQVPYQSPRPWFILLPVCILGVVVSDVLLYGAGRFWGMRVLKFPWMRRLLPPERFQRIQKNFRKYGVLILLFARILPGIRSPIFLSAGILKLPVRRFILADGIYAIPGVSLLFFLAYWFTDSFLDLVLRVKGEVDRIRPLLILTGILAVGVYFVIHFLRKPVVTGDPDELPLIGNQVAATMQGAEAAEAPNGVAPPPEEPAERKPVT